MKKELIEYLSDFMTEARYELLSKTITHRTRYFTIVLEDIYQSQNASAVLRSSECFGIQDVHIIENQNTYEINPDVTQGSSKWLNMHLYNEQANNTATALKKLKSEGYRIVATTPHKDDVNLEEFDIEKGKAAFVFGTEMRGISDVVYEHADEFMKIPMYGFTESFNISVSAAITLHHLTHKLRSSNIDWHLSENESQEILIEWMKKTIKSSEMLIDKFNSQKKH